MPNYCANTLIVSGPNADLRAFYDLVHKPTAQNPEELEICRTLLPPPPELHDLSPELLSDADHNWRMQHWGTKWGDWDHSNIYGAGHPTSTFETNFTSAWSPPAPAIDAIGQLYPTLTFDLNYSEADMCFQGRFAMHEGICTCNYTENYAPQDPENV